MRYLGGFVCILFAMVGALALQGCDSATPVNDVIVLPNSPALVTSLAFSPDGKTLASGIGDVLHNSYDGVWLWDVNSPEKSAAKLQGQTTGDIAVAFDPKGRYLISGELNGTIHIWDATNLQATPRAVQSDCAVRTITFSADGLYLGMGCEDGTVRVWDGSMSKPPTTLGEKTGYMVSSVAFSPDGHTIAADSKDATISLWNLDKPRSLPVVLRGHSESVTAVAFTPDGRILASGSYDGTIKLWHLREPDSQATVLTSAKQARPGGVNSIDDGIVTIALSPDGQYLAAGGSLDKKIRLWNLVKTDEAPVILSGHIGQVRQLAFSPDGRFLASAATDAAIRLWAYHSSNDPGRTP